MKVEEMLDSTMEMSHLINDRQRSLTAMKMYANQKLDQAAEEATASIGYGILGTKMPEYHPVVNKKSILRLKDNI